MPDILNKILATKLDEISSQSKVLSISELENRCQFQTPTRGFVQALEKRINSGNSAVISEIKKASPSKGIIRQHFDPAWIARNYAENGAACLSVLTDIKYFQGHPKHLEQARSVCNLPVLRKDFIINSYQVYESRTIGADAILLIVAALEDATLQKLTALAISLGMDVLVEIHDREELDRALALPCQLIGINNRNLHTFETSLHTTICLLDQIPSDRIVVTESGIHSKYDVALMRANGVHAFLVGETFMRANDPGTKLQELFGNRQ